MTMENICLFFKFGYCKFKTSCNKKHVTQVCDDQKCNVTKCQKRHPRMCKFFINSGSCKLGDLCAYSHVRRNENENLEKKLDELIDTIKKKDDAIVRCESKIDELVKINLEKEKIIEKLVKNVKEINDFIVDLDFGVAEDNKEEEVDENDEATLEENNENTPVMAELVKASENSLKLLDTMEAEIKKSRKSSLECLKKKFKDHKEKIEKEVYSCEGIPPPHLTCILNVWMCDQTTLSGMIKKFEGFVDYKENVLEKIKKSKEEFNKFLNDPVTLSKW